MVNPVETFAAHWRTRPLISYLAAACSSAPTASESAAQATESRSEPVYMNSQMWPMVWKSTSSMTIMPVKASAMRDSEQSMRANTGDRAARTKRCARSSLSPMRRTTSLRAPDSQSARKSAASSSQLVAARAPKPQDDDPGPLSLICSGAMLIISCPSTVTEASKMTTSSAKPLRGSHKRSRLMKLSNPQPSPLMNSASSSNLCLTSPAWLSTDTEYSARVSLGQCAQRTETLIQPSLQRSLPRG
mmetsp:Transcript_3361/g.9618  ORF Transcript_3361/g.9618 Transcript_3361/m.9618 type:complete len:245 (+) Transcript_3361:226-960(+)